MRCLCRRQGPGMLLQVRLLHADKADVHRRGATGRVRQHAEGVGHTPARLADVLAGTEWSRDRTRVLGQRNEARAERILKETDRHSTRALSVQRRLRYSQLASCSGQGLCSAETGRRWSRDDRITVSVHGVQCSSTHIYISAITQHSSVI